MRIVESTRLDRDAGIVGGMGHGGDMEPVIYKRLDRDAGIAGDTRMPEERHSDTRESSKIWDLSEARLRRRHGFVECTALDGGTESRRRQ
jgi:hypothetical protein